MRLGVFCRNFVLISFEGSSEVTISGCRKLHLNFFFFFLSRGADSSGRMVCRLEHFCQIFFFTLVGA